MRNRSLLAAAVLAASCLGLCAAIDRRPAEADDSPKKEPAARPDQAPAERVLPGIRRDGTVQLANQWRLKPAGRQLQVGDFPVNVALHPSGQFLAVLHAGFGTHEIIVVELNRQRQNIISRTTLPQTFYGLAFAPDGKRLFASGGEFERVHQFDFDRGLLSNPRTILIGDGEIKKLIVGGIAVSPDGRDVFATGVFGDVVMRAPIENPNNQVIIPVPGPKVTPNKGGKAPPKGEPPSPPDGRKDPADKAPAAKKDAPAEPPGHPAHPYACLPEPGGKRLFVSLWAAACVAVIDLDRNEVAAYWPTAAHPTEMALAPNGKALFVACANSTKVSVLDPKSGKALQTIHCALYPQAPNGNTPNSLCLTPDGELLFVANADANNLAVFNVAEPNEAKPLGFIPVGWYPTSVRFNPTDKRLYVANGKGVLPHSNRAGPGPYGGAPLTEYIGGLYHGTVSVIDMPNPERMAAYSKQAYACSPLRKNADVNAENVAADNPIPRKVGDPSPIKYVIYVIKENRTYDQVFGDLKQGNGEADLCLFPEAVTPNHHKLVREFVLLDNFYVDGEVSADGHEWSMGAYATDFVEKNWPLTYRGGGKNKIGYPSEGAYDYIERPAGGYIWDRAAEAKVTYRNYGEWIDNGRMNKDGTFEPGKPRVKALEGHFDPGFRGYDLDYPDVKRAQRFVAEVQRFEKAGEMPRLQIVRLPNDHTYGTRVGKPTPTALVADNDLALGMLVEGVSKSKFWKETAIFVVEDDAQNGPDHVDAHRSVALVISPYTKRKHVDSTMYSTSSMLRTMELILGLKPMSQFDAAARPMFNSFTAKPDATPYTHEVPKTDLEAKNVAGAWGSERSQGFDLSKEDAADDLLFNEVIWRSVKGPHSPMPAPVRAAFVRPIPKEDKDDD